MTCGTHPSQRVAVELKAAAERKGEEQEARAGPGSARDRVDIRRRDMDEGAAAAER